MPPSPEGVGAIPGIGSQLPRREGRLIPGSQEGRVERRMSGAYTMPRTLLVLSQICPQSSSWVCWGSV